MALFIHKGILSVRMDVPVNMCAEDITLLIKTNSIQYYYKQRYRNVIKLMIILFKSMVCPCLEYHSQQNKL